MIQTRHTRQGRNQKFVSEGDKTGVWGQKSPSGVQGQSPGGGQGEKPPEAEDIYKLDGQGRARREAARRRKSEWKVNLGIRNSTLSNGSW